MNFLIFLGLLLSFLGSLLLAFSVSENPGRAHQMQNGKKIYLASIDTKKFKWGIKLLVVGIFLQLIPFIAEWVGEFYGSGMQGD